MTIFNTADFLWLIKRLQYGPAAASLDEILEEWRDALLDLAEAYSRLDPAKELVMAREAPGYLYADLEDARVFVPWCLVKLFPGTAAVSQLLRVGRGVTVPDVENVCISGSAALLGDDDAIGDLDFAQYVPLAPSNLTPYVQAFRQPRSERVLVSLQYGDGPGRRITAAAPWGDWPLLEARMNACSVIESAERLLVDFLGVGIGSNLLPISTVILSSDLRNRSVGSARRSFVFQELVTLSGRPNGPIWPLIDVEQLSEYADFLRTQMIDYLEENPIKAAKRALSLARLTEVRDVARQAEDLLLSPESASYIAGKRAADVARQLERCGDTERAMLAPLLSPFETRTAETGSDSLALDEGLLRRCTEIVRSLIILLDELEAEVEGESER